MGVMSRPLTNVMTAPLTRVMGPTSGAPNSENDLYLINDNTNDALLLADTGSDRLIVSA